MALALRKEWQTAKGAAELLFKREHPPVGDIHINPPTPYPLKFKEDLGPTLDEFEKAKTPADKTKHSNKAKGVIRNYRTAINGAHELKSAARILLDSLAKIERALG